MDHLDWDTLMGKPLPRCSYVCILINMEQAKSLHGGQEQPNNIHGRRCNPITKALRAVDLSLSDGALWISRFLSSRSYSNDPVVVLDHFKASKELRLDDKST
jgi:hypothetical protein